ncbi:MAG: glycerophosphodiester phosphodiesterase [Fulvimarina manganoxydans]|uniref:glycerophosphodiester phosphodiesterase family protein n=1 Tax=Fulvimarina manganoxydans TaxID=937218 RepID=UPI002354075D|nr:glycerophosphodiester phosphodiesterase family protein [Fulvimarina manganoxydans]MCK5932490.1 glycerophosphodiester phosphodiesterase [Fulvimarina manganoxydans]
MASRKDLWFLALLSCLTGPVLAQESASTSAEVGVRPAYLVDTLEDGPLKEKLASCIGQPMEANDWSIGHRGAPLQFSEHSRQSYTAAARQGAGVIECDVAFTKDRELVCRHAQCDLATTTDILTRPELAAKCTNPFSPATDGAEATATCCTSDLTLAEFRSLNAKMDSSDKTATTAEAFQGGNASWRTTLYSPGTLMTHKDSIDLIKSFGRKFTPELKTPEVAMPFEGDYSQEDYARQMIEDYIAAGVEPKDVYPQSFNLDDVRFWIREYPEFGQQAVYLDNRDETLEGLDPMKPETFEPSMQALADEGVQIIAPPLWMLVTAKDGEIVPSPYAEAAKAAGLDIITWSLERSGPLASGGGWYYQSISDITDSDGDMLKLLDVLANQVGVIGVFSDWPATTTFFANCMGLGQTASAAQ